MSPKDSRIPKPMLVLFFSDLILLAFVPVFCLNLHLWSDSGAWRAISWSGLDYRPFGLLVVVFLSSLLAFDQYNVNQDFRRGKVFFRMLLALVTGCALYMAGLHVINFLHHGGTISLPSQILLFSSGGILVIRLIYSVVRSVGVCDKRTLIVGYGDSGKRILDVIRRNPSFRLKVVGILSRNEDTAGKVDMVPVIWQKGSLRDEVQKYNPKVLIVAMRRDRFYDLVDDLTWCAQQGIEIWDTPTTYEYLEKRIPLRYVDDLWLYYAAVNWPKLHVTMLKRVLDIFVSVIGLVLAIPIMALALLAVYIETGTPLILSQQRVGKNGRLINIYKIRSMYTTCPKPGEKGCQVNDVRVTKVGRVLRNLHFDEVPQLINVLRGDLSVIGPRAEMYDFIHEFLENGLPVDAASRPGLLGQSRARSNTRKTAGAGSHDTGNGKRFVPYIEQRFTVDQGITGWAQVMRPHVTSTYEDMKVKLEYDLYYIKNISLILDIQILLKTVKMVMLGKGK